MRKLSGEMIILAEISHISQNTGARYALNTINVKLKGYVKGILSIT